MQEMPPYGYGYSGEYGPRPAPSLEQKVTKRLGIALLIFTAAFGLTMAVVVGQRLSDQALAVIAGAVCGVVASIPPSLLIIWVTKRKQERPQAWAGPYPPVVVVQPPLGYPAGDANRYLQPPMMGSSMAQPIPREFIVVGEE